MLTNPAEPVSPSKDQSKGAREYEIWLADEIQDFLAATAESEYFPLYVAALNTGMRLNELVGLQWDRVDLRRSIIRVTRTWCLKSKKLKDVTKGRKSRTIPINRSLAPVLAELRLRGHKPWVFCDADGNRIESNTFTEQIFKPTCKRAGVKVIRFHDLRHTYASHFMMNGGDVFLLQQVLGHKDITTTQQYLHFAQEFLQEAAEVVEFGLPQEGGDVVPLRWGKNG
jgi:integrase